MTDNPTFVEYIGAGAQTDFVFPFSYLDADHIAVTVVGVDRAFTLPSQNTVRISPAPTGLVRISRETPGEALVTFSDGVVILGADLNASGSQPRYIAEEARDVAVEAKEIASTNVDAALAAVVAAQAQVGLAAGHRNAAAASALEADATKTLIAGIYDSFDDRYLGLKTADPTVDNDGAALVVGAIYFNTTLQSLRLFTSSGWQSAYIPTDGSVMSFNGRTGSVVPVSGDYDIATITGLQTALTGKAASTHDHAGQAIVPDTLRFAKAFNLASGTDLDTVLVGGFYDVPSASNKPAGSSNWGYLQVNVHSNNSAFATQSWTDLDVAPAKVWVRTRGSSVWSGWQSITTITPTVQRFTSGSGTYTPSPGARYIRVRMVGGGGGGAAQNTNAGQTGTVTTFGGWQAFAGNGGNPAAGTAGAGASGGADGSGTLVNRVSGQNGFIYWQLNGSITAGGHGGDSAFFGGGAPGSSGTGVAGKANTGGGGSGGGNGSGGSGGGAGECVEFFVSAPVAVSYTVGTGGPGGAAGGIAGAAGAAGVIIVEEFY